ncbi:protein gone early [Episyrphus balteatus]|uniref:protein gone early n=1 Tax=Episyrphus balteatus TaxID=286459 RepID=UPI002485AE6E|nr:protein gone early [Episyrphus balteatus]XP_055840887.1 protein gone early [Episyrphus balteatus]XP_055840888.1 protein gone early [Episyrphus balteatus]
MATKPDQDVVDKVKNGDNEKYNQKLDGNTETLPLTTNKTKAEVESRDAESGKTRRGRLSFDALMQLSPKRRLLYIATASLCALLLVIIIFLIAFWPEVPFYLKAELCVDKECVLASQQILLWSNISYKPCQNTYKWACGNFRKEYEENDYFVIKRGEWDYQTYNEYEELSELNRFISMLPTSSQSYSAESMISNLYKSCREIDALDKSQSNMLLRQAIKSVDGWQALRDGNRLQFWEYRKALVYAQTHHGVFPYFKMSVENRYTEPYDYIITLDAGDVGLPDEFFYNVDTNDEVVVAYKMLLRDFAINMGVVTQEAELFADEIFHYEKRIVNNILSVQSSSQRRLNEIKTIQEIKNIAPSLPVFESLQAIFPQIKITDDTEILVRDVDVLHEMSIVVSTSDKKPLNNFIIWSLARKILPHLSKEYRILIENFDDALYGKTARYPRWMVCAKIVRDWLPFSVDALRENPNLLKFGSDSQMNIFRQKSFTFPNKTYGNDEFMQLMFYTLRNQVALSIVEANWIEPSLKNFIYDKLASTRLQIGIPSEILQTKAYIDEYYKSLMLYNLYFVEHLESIWKFRKLRLQDKLKSQSIIDMIILEMYATDNVKPVTYSTTLNMILISKQLSQSKYYDYRFPIPVNFARVGADIVEKLIETISIFEKQYRFSSKSSDSNEESIFKINTQCIENDVMDIDLSESSLSSFHTIMSAARITAKALTRFIESIDSAAPITGASIDPSLTYENLQLTNRKRLPGLRSLNENELFTLAYMQKHCSTPIADKDYARIKPHVEKKLAEMYLFNATWRHIQFLPRSSSCSVNENTCTNIL